MARPRLTAAGPVFEEALAPGLGAHTAQGAGVTVPLLGLVGLVALARSQTVAALEALRAGPG